VQSFVQHYNENLFQVIVWSVKPVLSQQHSLLQFKRNHQHAAMLWHNRQQNSNLCCNSIKYWWQGCIWRREVGL